MAPPNIPSGDLQWYFLCFAAIILVSLFAVLWRNRAAPELKVLHDASAEPCVFRSNNGDDEQEETVVAKVEAITRAEQSNHERPPLELSSDPYAEIDQYIVREPTSDKVEIFAVGPEVVGSDQSFRIFVNVLNLAKEAEIGHPNADTFDSILAEVQRGSRIGVVFEVLPILQGGNWIPPQWRVDAPYQALTWQGNNLILDFVARSKTIHKPTLLQAHLWLTIGTRGGLPRAKLDLSVQAQPNFDDQKPKRLFVLPQATSDENQMAQVDIQSTWQISQYTGVGRNALAFNKAFIFYKRDDDFLARHYMALLQAAGVACGRDQEMFMPFDDWKEQLDPFLLEADIIVVIWTEAASKSENVEYELQRVEAVRKQRKRDHDAYMKAKSKARPGRPNPSPVKPEPVVYILHLDDNAKPPPDWFRENMGHAATPERLRTGQYPSSPRPQPAASVH